MHLDTFEMKALRKILRVSWTMTKTNEWVLNKAGIKRELLDTIKARRLAYYGCSFVIVGRGLAYSGPQRGYHVAVQCACLGGRGGELVGVCVVVRCIHTYIRVFCIAHINLIESLCACARHAGKASEVGSEQLE